MIYRLIYAAIAILFIAGISRAEAIDALDEVNAARAARGLRPYIRDANLTAGAMNVATFRASRMTSGHTQNDFSGLPVGTSADAAGCAAWPPGLGWGSCATYDNYTFAGAAWAMGPNGLRFMQLFVRGSSTERISHASQTRFTSRYAPRGRRR